MGTDFSVVRDYIRAAVQDWDVECHIYSDSALNSQIRFAIIQLCSNPNGPFEESPSLFFSTDLTSKQLLVVSIKSAINILSGKPRDFSWKSPVMSVSRKGGVNEMIDILERALLDAEGGIFSLSYDTDFNAIIMGFDRYFNCLDRAESSWLGPTSSDTLGNP